MKVDGASGRPNHQDLASIRDPLAALDSPCDEEGARLRDRPIGDDKLAALARVASRGLLMGRVGGPPDARVMAAFTTLR